MTDQSNDRPAVSPLRDDRGHDDPPLWLEAGTGRRRDGILHLFIALSGGSCRRTSGQSCISVQCGTRQRSSTQFLINCSLSGSRHQGALELGQSPPEGPSASSELEQIVHSPAAVLLAARSSEKIVGMLTLVIFRIPTGVRGDR
jgi:hypothetical protein